jgi:hypothetical protein
MGPQVKPEPVPEKPETKTGPTLNEEQAEAVARLRSWDRRRQITEANPEIPPMRVTEELTEAYVRLYPMLSKEDKAIVSVMAERFSQVVRPPYQVPANACLTKPAPA